MNVVADHVRMQNIKTLLQKIKLQICLKRLLWLKNFPKRCNCSGRNVKVELDLSDHAIRPPGNNEFVEKAIYNVYKVNAIPTTDASNFVNKIDYDLKSVKMIENLHIVAYKVLLQNLII